MDETREEEVAAKNTGGRPPKQARAARNRQPPKSSRRKRLRLSKATKEVYKDPVKRARAQINMAKARAALNRPSRLGVPDGWNWAQADAQRVYDGIKADIILDRMKAEGMVDETKPSDFEVMFVEHNGLTVEVRVPKTEAGMAEAALREAVIGAISPLTHAASKVSYIRTVLEWTKKKPASDSNVNLSSEEWLTAALKDNDGYDAGEDSAS